MRAPLAVLALTAVATVAGCGSSTGHKERGAPRPGSLEALWRQSRQSVSLVPGTSDYSPGALRISFLVLSQHARPIERPRARFWVARDLSAKPFEQTTASLESIGVPGASADEGGVSALYVAHVRVPSSGRYWVLARPERATIGAAATISVHDEPASPAIGSRAYASDTPTLASAHGRLALLTTRTPPDRGLLRYSIAGSLAARTPFVVTFATPRFCTSRTCGPVVDVVDAARRTFERRGIHFIHVEIYEDNDPAKHENRWVRQWRLPTEPWTFLVGRDGRIKAKFEGSVSLRELSAAVRGHLLR